MVDIRAENGVVDGKPQPWCIFKPVANPNPYRERAAEVLPFGNARTKSRMGYLPVFSGSHPEIEIPEPFGPCWGGEHNQETQDDEDDYREMCQFHFATALFHKSSFAVFVSVTMGVGSNYLFALVAGQGGVF